MRIHNLDNSYNVTTGHKWFTRKLVERANEKTISQLLPSNGALSRMTESCGYTIESQVKKSGLHFNIMDNLGRIVADLDLSWDKINAAFGKAFPNL